MTAKRAVPLTGILAVILVVAGVFVGGEVPGADAPASEIAAFYTENDSDQILSAILAGYGMFFFLCFAAVLYGALRRSEGAGQGASALSFAGAIVFAVGGLIFAGLGFVLGDAPDKLDPSALQALNALNANLFMPVAIGGLAFLAGSGIAVVTTGALPKWLGWLAIVGAIFSATPLFFIAFIVLGLWILIVSVLLTSAAEAA